MGFLDLELEGGGAAKGEVYHWERKPNGVSVSRKK